MADESIIKINNINRRYATASENNNEYRSFSSDI